MDKIGTVIDSRPDGSFIYQSSIGILNLDNKSDLDDAIKEDASFLMNGGENADKLLQS